MPSKQSEAVRKRWEASRLAMVQPGFEAPDDESWGDLTAEPRGVDYLETEAGGLQAMWAVPKGASTDRVLMCIHGGGFVSGSIYTHRKMFGHLAKAAGVRALIVSYHLLPEGVFPVPVDDVTSAYQWLLDQGISAGHIAFAGDSVGGWLAITVQLRAREQGLPLPAAALLISPCVDMETTGESYEANRDSDPFFKPDVVRGIIRGFLGEGTDARDPRANPLYANLSGLGPVCIQAGVEETLADDARLLDEHARKAGVDARLDIFPGMLRSESEDPGAIVAEREWLRLALIASLQYLPARQRAVLLLREVLGFPAAEVAGMLGTSTAAVKSALQRARVRLDEVAPTPGQVIEPADPRARKLLSQYIAGFENADTAALEQALRADAAIELVGTRTWFSGRATCLRYLAHVIGSPGDWRMAPTLANGQPAAVARYRDSAYGLGVLTVTPAGIARVTVFGGGPDLAARFGFGPAGEEGTGQARGRCPQSCDDGAGEGMPRR